MFSRRKAFIRFCHLSKTGPFISTSNDTDEHHIECLKLLEINHRVQGLYDTSQKLSVP